MSDKPFSDLLRRMAEYNRRIVIERPGEAVIEGRQLQALVKAEKAAARGNEKTCRQFVAAAVRHSDELLAQGNWRGAELQKFIDEATALLSNEAMPHD